MKRILFLFFILLSLLQAKASDTLTVRQVYNFNVGDTFQYYYSYDNYDLGLHNHYYYTVVIQSKSLNAASDTLTYNGNWVITNLDSIAVYQVDSLSRADWLTSVVFFDTTTYRGFLSNDISSELSTYDGGYSYTLTQGLGLTVNENSMIDNSGSQYNTENISLTYYSNGTVRYGRYVYPSVINYQPLPESCAIWNMFSGVPDYVSTDTLYEQIRTGNIIDTGGYRWVEMIYRSYDPVTNYFTDDSLIGYFANDTINKMVYYENDLSGTNYQEMYDFKLNNGNAGYCGAVIKLSQDTIAGTIRTEWQNTNTECCTGNDYYDPVCIKLSYISGVGGTGGLMSVKSLNGFPFYASTLTSLCVCGNIIYPDTASGQSCTLLTGINNIDQATFASAIVSPNPTADLLHLSISDVGQYNTQFIITDILGQEVYSSPITQSETTHDISKLTSGIYTWRVVSPQTPKGGLNTNSNNIIKTGKIVKE